MKRRTEKKRAARRRHEDRKWLKRLRDAHDIALSEIRMAGVFEETVLAQGHVGPAYTFRWNPPKLGSEHHGYLVKTVV